MIERAAAGEEILIAEHGKPLARLVSCAHAGQPRQGGQWKDRVGIHDDFDAPLPTSIHKAFRGRDQ